MEHKGAGEVADEQIMECIQTTLEKCREIIQHGGFTELEVGMCQELEDEIVNDCGSLDSIDDLAEELLESGEQDTTMFQSVIFCRRLVQQRLAECNYKIQGGGITELSQADWIACRPAIEDHVTGVSQP